MRKIGPRRRAMSGPGRTADNVRLGRNCRRRSFPGSRPRSRGPGSKGGRAAGTGGRVGRTCRGLQAHAKGFYMLFLKQGAANVPGGFFDVF